MKKRWWAVAMGVVLVVAGVTTIGGCTAFGGSASGERRARMQQSPEWRKDRFVNPQPLWSESWKAMLRVLSTTPGDVPDAPVPVVVSDGSSFEVPPASGLRVTWYGHSSSLIEIDGTTLLTDPIWSERPSPIPQIGPARFYPPPIALDRLPKVDAVLISHDHYDHLDVATITAMRDWTNVFIVPLGIGAHLARWGIPAERIVELDWWQSARVGSIEITLTPARHASGRIDPQSDKTLWAGFAMVGKSHRAYYSGDTGLFRAIDEVGERFGPFDVALVEAGQYDADWPDWHLGPEQAVTTALALRAKVLIPVHWGLFKLAHHTWTEPVERVLAAAACVGLPVLVPRPGESVEPTIDTATARAPWWPHTHWQNAQAAPIIATRNGVPSMRVEPFSCTALAKG
ncbi:MAG: metallo-beta-lactamase superfamily protein [Rhizobacter sp.]|nr:metallo-beta-lactamase superfamily protein [Rhizobacter sp.]